MQVSRGISSDGNRSRQAAAQSCLDGYRGRAGLDLEGVGERQAEGLGLDLEDVAGLGADAVGEGEGGGAEHVDVQIAGLAEERVLEVVVLEVGDGVAHVGLAGEEGLFPDRLAVAADAARALDVVGQGADQDFRAEGGGPELGVGEEEVVLPLGDVVGELVGEREADAVRRAVRADQVDAGDLRLLAGVEREGGAEERGAGADRLGAVALVEPFGLHAGKLGRLAAFEAHAEHLHRVGQRLDGGALVHGVAGGGAAEMGEAGAGEVQMRRVGVGDRGEEPALGEGGGEVDLGAEAAGARPPRRARRRR